MTVSPPEGRSGGSSSIWCEEERFRLPLDGMDGLQSLRPQELFAAGPTHSHQDR